MLDSPSEPQLGGKIAAHFQKNVLCFKGVSRLKADVLFIGPTVARIHIDRMGFALPSWNVKVKELEVTLTTVMMSFHHVFASTTWVRFFNTREMKFPSNFIQKATLCPSVNRTFVKLNQQTVCGLETWSYWKENSFRLVLFVFFPLMCRNILTKEVESSAASVQRKLRLLQTVWQITRVMH